LQFVGRAALRSADSQGLPDFWDDIQGYGLRFGLNGVGPADVHHNGDAADFGGSIVYRSGDSCSVACIPLRVQTRGDNVCCEA